VISMSNWTPNYKVLGFQIFSLLTTPIPGQLEIFGFGNFRCLPGFRQAWSRAIIVSHGTWGELRISCMHRGLSVDTYKDMYLSASCRLGIIQPSSRRWPSIMG